MALCGVITQRLCSLSYYKVPIYGALLPIELQGLLIFSILVSSSLHGRQSITYHTTFDVDADDASGGIIYQVSFSHHFVPMRKSMRVVITPQ